jgi:membrane fusion protein, hemolysin D
MAEIESPKIVPMRRRVRARPMDDADLQFLPPADQILATPPSPIRMQLLLAICSFFLLALLAAWFSKIEIYAVASGRIQPTGRSKVVQPMQSGRVLAVRVTNGSQVSEGDTLLELDPTESAAELEASAQVLGGLRAEIARRKTEIALATERRFSMAGPVGFDVDIDAETRNRQQAILEADMGELRATLKSLDSQIAENAARKAALTSTIAQQERLIATLEQRFAISDSVEKEGLESKSNVLDVRQTLDREVMTLVTQKGELSKVDASTTSIRTNKEDAIAKFIAQNTQALDSAASKRDEMTQNLVKSTARVGYMRLTAPIAGTVQELG